MLHQKYDEKTLKSILTPLEKYRPHPTIEDRARWAAIPDTVRDAYVRAADRLRAAGVPSLPATLFLEYSRIGNRTNYQRPHHGRRAILETLVAAECIEAEGRFLDDIVDFIWAICEETYWGVPAHIRVQKAGNTLPDAAEPTVDLFAAETGNLIAWTYYLLGDRLDAVSPLVRERMVLEMRRRILDPLWERDDFHWMGFTLREDQRRVNNWNPWICSNWLASTLLMETDEERRVKTVSKILRAVDNFIDPYPEDGGCDEGPSYWGRAGASLFDDLDLLFHATDGRVSVYDEPKIRNIGKFIYRVHIDGDYYVNFADAPAHVFPDAALVYSYGHAIADDAMMSHGAWLAARQGLKKHGGAESSGERAVNFQRLLRRLFTLTALPAPPDAAPLPRDVWLPDIEVVTARDRAGTGNGFFLAAKGGHNSESHNHNDVGCLVVYVDGKPLVIDAGVEAYTARTFSPDRYSIWTMRSSYHNFLPMVDGVEQKPGFTFRASDAAYEITDTEVRFSLELATAYPEDAKIASWRRAIAFARAERVTVTDEYRLSADADELVVAFLTPCAVDAGAPGTVLLGSRATASGLESGEGRVAYDGDVFHATVETVETTDERLAPIWGNHIYRVVLTAKKPATAGRLAYTITR